MNEPMDSALAPTQQRQRGGRASRFVKRKYVNYSARRILRSRVYVLLGANRVVVSLLRKKDIATVLDLAERVGSARAPTGDLELGKRFAEIARELTSGKGFRSLEPRVRALAQAAYWVHQSYLVPESYAESPDAPRGLVPRAGEYPTEKLFFSTLVMDRAPSVARGELRDVAKTGPIDIVEGMSPDRVSPEVGEGAQLTFSQSWFFQELALGHLLHSVALAPGESTLIAIEDWERRASETLSETVADTERLANVSERNRSITEVQQAMAREMQRGDSGSRVDSYSEQRGTSGGGGLFGAIFGGGSSSSGSSRSGMTATAWSSSSGRRDMRAEMEQKLLDRIQQLSAASRDRRSLVVREVSQSERQQVSTRALANYNHMHALTIQYYEAVQIYRVGVQLEQVEPCLFVPVKPFNFRGPEGAATIARFRIELGDVALTPEVRDALRNPIRRLRVTGGEVVASGSFLGFGSTMTRSASTWLSADALLAAATDAEGADVDLDFYVRDEDSRLLPDALSALAHAPEATGTATPAPTSTSAPAANPPRGPTVFKAERVRGLKLPAGMFEKVVGPSLKKNAKVTFRFTDGGATYTIAADAIDQRPLLELDDSAEFAGLTEHFAQNAIHYTAAILRRTSPSAIAAILAKYSHKGTSLLSKVDPTPVAVAGPYLVMRVRFTSETLDEDAATKSWLQRHEFEEFLPGIERDARRRAGRMPTRYTVVALPSGGVFGEAVLGRSNSAEKLDLSRFWNWKDSPIPIQAPAIQPPTLQSRRETVNLEPPQLSPSLVSIQAPNAIPDPAGLGAILQALQGGALFRDMSGSASLSALAQAALAAAQGGAKSGAEAGTEMLKASNAAGLSALDLISGLLSRGSPNPSGGLSQQGALVNEGKKRDTRAKEKADEKKGAKTGATGKAKGNGSAASQMEDAAFSAAVAGSSPAGLLQYLTRLANGLIPDADAGARKLPDFAALWEAHPGADRPCLKKHRNQCAIRLGVALRTAGVDLSSFRGTLCTHVDHTDHKPPHVLRAQQLASWLESNFGTANRRRSVTQEDYRDKRGIVFLEDFNGRATDHIDLWDGKAMELRHGDVNWFAIATQVWFWPIK